MDIYNSRILELTLLICILKLEFDVNEYLHLSDFGTDTYDLYFKFRLDVN